MTEGRARGPRADRSSEGARTNDRPSGEPTEIEELRARVARLEAELAERRQALDEARRARERDARDLARAQADLRALRAVPLVRLGLATKARARRLRADGIERLKDVARIPRRAAKRVVRRIRLFRLRASAADEERVRAAIVAGIPPSSTTTGPLVSIVILNRDGEAHLRRCLPALAATTYRDVEVLVVDNDSRDGSVAYAESFACPFPLRVLRNPENLTFGVANDRAADEATGELVLFLNNDIEPITPDWLGHLVDTLTTRDAAAVGARLVYPRHRGVDRGGEQWADLTLQHRGIGLDRAAGGIPFPVALGAGEDPTGPAAVTVSEVLGATAACLLVRRTAFEAVGGFGEGYEYGLEDVDLNLRLRAAGGTVWYDGRAALWHHESATRRNDDMAIRKERAARNRTLLIDRWGPRLTREALLDAIDGRLAWSSAPLHVGIAITRDDESAGYGDWHTGHELGDALRAIGWRVSYLERVEDRWYRPPADLDVVVSLLDAFDLRRIPRRPVSVAWVRNWPDRWAAQPWFDDYDIVLASSAGIAALLDERTATRTHRVPIATNPARFRPVEPDPELACDVLFTGSHWGAERGVATALPALAAAGLRVHVHGRGWEGVADMAPLLRPYLPYDRLAAAYASAGVVVDDTAHHARPYGAVNSRAFDAIAAGAVLVSDNEAGCRELFGDGIPTWTDAESLISAVRALLADPAAARARMAPIRERVLAEHTYAQRATAVRDALRTWTAARRVGIRIGVPSWEVAHQWGDLPFARSVQRELERAGHPTRVHFLPDWDAEHAARDDATLHLFGLRTPRKRAGQVNLLWQISHPDLASGELYDTYDAVFVASDRFAEHMAAQTRTPVRPLHQATDPARFRPTSGGPAHELLFVANARRHRRKIVDDLGATTRDLAVYGAGWTADLIDLRFVRGENVPNAQLPAYYSAATIVLNDHWADMRDWGFLSNRLYDALACGAVVVSDRAPGIDEEFDGTVVAYDTPEELRAAIDRVLADDAERRARGERGRAVVLARHTFAHRVAELTAALGPLLAARLSRIVAEPAARAPAAPRRRTPAPLRRPAPAAR